MTSPTSPLAYEKVWFEKSKYDEAEKLHFERLVKLHINHGMVKIPSSKHVPAAAPVSVVHKQPPVIPVVAKSSPLKRQVNVPLPIQELSPATPILIPSTQTQIEDEKRFKLKEAKEKRNKADKKGRDRSIPKDETKGSSNNPLKNSLAGEVAKVRQHIQNSLECMDGIAALATNVNVEIVNRLNSVEKKNHDLNKQVSELQSHIKQLEARIHTLEGRCATAGGGKTAPSPKPAAPAHKTAPSPSSKPSKPANDDDVDLFASGSEDESLAITKVKKEAAASKKKSKKQEIIQKSIVILDVKPWDDETDMKAMEEVVRKITMDGLLWGASKLVPLAYGIHKLQITCVVEDEKVSIDALQENIQELDDYVQSVDIAAFNKL